MPTHKQSVCDINMERPLLTYLVFPTLVTLSNAFVTNEKLEKIVTGPQGFQKSNSWVLDPL